MRAAIARILRATAAELDPEPKIMEHFHMSGGERAAIMAHVRKELAKRRGQPPHAQP